MSKYLSRDDILSKQGIQTDEVEVPEWGGVVLVRELSAAEVARIGFGMAGRDGEGVEVNLEKLGEYVPQMITWCVVDEDLKPIFSIDDVNQLSAKSINPVQQIITKVMELSDLSPDESELEKN